MIWKPIVAAAILAGLASPAQAWDILREEPHTMFFVKVPLDGRSPKEQMPTWGLSLRGKKEYQALSVDNHMMNSFVQMGFIESKIIIVGVVAAAGAVAVAASGSKSAARQEQQLQQTQQQQEAQRLAQQQAAQQPPVPCPQKPKPAC